MVRNAMRLLVQEVLQEVRRAMSIVRTVMSHCNREADGSTPGVAAANCRGAGVRASGFAAHVRRLFMSLDLCMA